VKIPRQILEYEKKFALNLRPLISSSLGGVEQLVVIPALAEKSSLFATLAGLSRNCRKELKRTLALCVINNRVVHSASVCDIEDNQKTIAYLHALIKGSPCEFIEDEKLSAYMKVISSSHLRLAYIDASSPGSEMPDKAGGVGAARKIGMDTALKIFDYGTTVDKLLLCLDADTLVEDNYLEAVRQFFDTAGKAVAVVNYSHQRPKTSRERLAIGAYEIFLRYYVLGLRYAGSPYAFHTVGSTMACTADAYVAIGGMNRRDAAEDFYFLNKMAKYTEIGRITNTTVHPSARLSSRVPFGTGRRMVRFIEGRGDEFLMYDPNVFLILKKWLGTMKSFPDRQPEDILTLAQKIALPLFSFLEENDFFNIWERIRKNTKNSAGLLRHFHFWFDGFKTLKLIHFLTDHGFPQVDMFCAVEELFRMTNGKSNYRMIPSSVS
jgi:hypothetical protein